VLSKYSTWTNIVYAFTLKKGEIGKKGAVRSPKKVKQEIRQT
jgi:hypothetical protein